MWVGRGGCFGRVSSVDEVEGARGRPGALLTVHSLGSLGSWVCGGSGFLTIFCMSGS